MTDIKFITGGDATEPIGDDNKIICHVCNNKGKWGAGFVLAISKKWPEPEREYKNWYLTRGFVGLGDVQYVRIKPGLIVANMIAQDGLYPNEVGKKPIRYPSLDDCLRKVAQKAKETNSSVHMPRIGCGLAGGTWFRVEEIINKTLIASGVNVTVYDWET